jgi:hypothetical protein
VARYLTNILRTLSLRTRTTGAYPINGTLEDDKFEGERRAGNLQFSGHESLISKKASTIHSVVGITRRHKYSNGLMYLNKYFIVIYVSRNYFS